MKIDTLRYAHIYIYSAQRGREREREREEREREIQRDMSSVYNLQWTHQQINHILPKQLDLYSSAHPVVSCALVKEKCLPRSSANCGDNGNSMKIQVQNDALRIRAIWARGLTGNREEISNII